MAPARVGAVVFVAAAACVTPALAAFVAEVTIHARVLVDPATRIREVEVTGSIASRAAGETVEVLARDCGPAHRQYRLVGAAKTAPGGIWRVAENDPQSPNYQSLPENAYYRARWKDKESELALIRAPAIVGTSWNARKRVVTVRVSTWQTGQDVRGRFVELQRQVRGTQQWVLVRRARLGPGAWEGYSGRVFRTRFHVPTRGLTLRVFVPDATGAPCFTAAASGAIET